MYFVCPLGVMKTEERHFAEACARQFLDVANQWGITDKISTIGTDSAPNMVAAGRILPFEHVPCVAHGVQRAIVMSFGKVVLMVHWPSAVKWSDISNTVRPTQTS